MLSENEIIVIIYLGGSFFVALLVVFLFIYVNLHKIKVSKYRIEIKEQEVRKQQAIFIAINEGEEKERKRLGEELHDGIGAKLSGIKMSIEYLRTNKITFSIHEKLVNKILESMNETIEELREISQNLNSSILKLRGLTISLEDLISHFNNKATCEYKLFIEIDEEHLTKYDHVGYRIVSELVNNIHKHSNATKATIQLFSNNNSFQIIVEDNGRGFEINHIKPGNGLFNIKNRVELYGGKIFIDSNTKGTVIIIEF